jgi:hypothetical protein
VIPTLPSEDIELVQPDVDALGPQIGGELQDEFAVFSRVREEVFAIRDWRRGHSLDAAVTAIPIA